MDKIHNSDLVFISVGPNFRLFKSSDSMMVPT